MTLSFGDCEAMALNKTLQQQYEIINRQAFQDSVKILKIYQNNGLLETAQQIAQSHSNVISQFNFLQQYQEMIQPFSKFSTQYSEIIKLNNAVKSTKIYNVIKKLSDANYVFWKFIPIELSEQLYNSHETDIILEKYELQTDGIETKEIFDLCLKSDFLKPQRILFSQSFEAYLNRQYNLAVIGLFSIIDGVLSEIVVDVNIKKTGLKKRCEKLLCKLKNEKLNNADYSILTFIKTFESAQNTFFASSDFSKDEPEYPNRHWIMHGKNTRINTRLDYIKLLRFFYGVILIDNLSKNE
jgi:hypothetical protein